MELKNGKISIILYKIDKMIGKLLIYGRVRITFCSDKHTKCHLKWVSKILYKRGKCKKNIRLVNKFSNTST